MSALLRLLAISLTVAALMRFDAHAQGKLWIVDGQGAGHFTTAQPAIDAAQDGDTILIRKNSSCGSMVIDGKSLTITGDVYPTGLNDACGSFTVRNLLPHQSVSARGIKAKGFLLQHNEGSVLLDHVVSGSSATFACSGSSPIAGDALRIEHCASVYVGLSSFHGGKGAALGGTGAWVEHSNAYFHSTTARGGFPTNPGAVKGGTGLVVVDSFVLWSG